MGGCGETGSERPYRPSFEWGDIIATLEERAGSQWDPRIIREALKWRGKTS